MPPLRRVHQPVRRTDAGLQAEVVVRRATGRRPPTHVEPDAHLRYLRGCGGHLESLSLSRIGEHQRAIALIPKQLDGPPALLRKRERSGVAADRAWPAHDIARAQVVPALHVVDGHLPHARQLEGRAGLYVEQRMGRPDPGERIATQVAQMVAETYRGPFSRQGQIAPKLVRQAKPARDPG